MTKPNTLSLFLLALLPWVTDALPAATADSGGPLPENVVARVAGRELTFDGFCLAAAQQKLPLLKNPGSNATTTLRLLIEERVIEQEARRLGITVTRQDVQRRFAEFEADVRKKFRGQKSLQDLMRERKTNLVEFRHELRKQVLKDRIAGHPSHLGDTLPDDPSARLIQIEIVIDKVLQRATTIFGVPVVLTQVKPTAMNKDWICTVQVGTTQAPVPVTKAQFGRALIMRLTTGDVRELLDIEIKTGLLASAGYKMTDADFDREIALQRRHWKIQRAMASQAALASISYDDWVKAKYQMDVDEMKRKRYWRGYLSLVQQMRDKVTDTEIRAEFDSKKDTHWGKFLLVTEIKIEFKADGAKFARADLRSHRQAQKLAREVPRLLAQGLPFEQVVRDINSKRDPTFRAQERRLRPNTDDMKVWERAVVMKDGDLSSPFETLSHVHLLRRVSEHPAPAYEDVRVVVRESLARQRARQWVEDRVTDESMVRIRWPLPQRGE